MNDPTTKRGNRMRSYILFVICGILAIAAALMGIDDNPPGILSAFLAAVAFVLAFTHSWRSARQYWFLLLGSVLGLALLVVLNNLFAAVAHSPETTGAFQLFMQAIAVLAFIVATLICPAGIFVSIIGLITIFIRNRRKPHPGPHAGA